MYLKGSPYEFYFGSDENEKFHRAKSTVEKFVTRKTVFIMKKVTTIILKCTGEWIQVYSYNLYNKEKYNIPRVENITTASLKYR